jgi:NitT/TauT family transport system permease protein
MTPDTTRRSGSARARNWISRALPPILVFFGVAAALEAYVGWRHVPVYLLPRPTAVVRTLWIDRTDLLRALSVTLAASLTGFAASTFFGTLAAVALSTSSLVRRAIYPYTLFFQTVPIVAVAPLLVFWFDAGVMAVAICAFIVSVFPVIANTLTGLLSTDPALLDLFRLYGARRWATLWKLRFPSALPSLFTGLRIAAGLAVIGTVVSEFLVGQLGENEGLGVKIVGATKMGRTDRVFAAVLLASLLGLAMFSGVNLASRLALRRWHASERAGE